MARHWTHCHHLLLSTYSSFSVVVGSSESSLVVNRCELLVDVPMGRPISLTVPHTRMLR